MAIVLAWALVALVSFALAAGLFAVALLRRLHGRESMFRAIAESASDGLVLMEMDSRIVWVNPAYCRIMGYDADEMIGRYPLEFALPADIAVTREEARGFRFDPGGEMFGKLTRVRNLRRTGEEFMHEFSHALVRGGRASRNRVLLIGRDVSESVAREQELIETRERLTRLAHTDPLTGLANRIGLRHRLDEMTAQSASFAVMLLDLDGFKAVNDLHGHHAGDALLKHVASRLAAHAGEGGFAARTGGDEFVLIAEGTGGLDAAVASAQDLARSIRAPMRWDAGEIAGGGSVGVALWTPGSLSADEVLQRADIALYDAKTGRSGRVRGYDAALHELHVTEDTMRHEVAEALQSGQMVFHYQPVLDLEASRVDRFEMLVCWTHPTRGVLPAAEVLAIVASLGLVDELDRQTIATAADALPQIDAAGLDAGLAVNLSGEALPDGAFADFLVWQADYGSLEPGRITIQTPAAPGGDGLHRGTGRLAAAGFRFCLDGFGTGRACLADLAARHLDGFRIDRRLTEAVERERASAEIVASLIDLAHRLDLSAVIDGVGTTGQIACLAKMGGALIQGDAIAPPMPLDEAIRWARRQERPASRPRAG